MTLGQFFANQCNTYVDLAIGLIAAFLTWKQISLGLYQHENPGTSHKAKSPHSKKRYLYELAVFFVLVVSFLIFILIIQYQASLVPPVPRPPVPAPVPITPPVAPPVLPTPQPQNPPQIQAPILPKIQKPFHQHKQVLRSPTTIQAIIPVSPKITTIPSTISVIAPDSGDENHYLAARVADDLGTWLLGKTIKNSQLRIKILSVEIEPFNTGNPCENENSQWSVEAFVELSVSMNDIPDSDFPDTVTGTTTVCSDEYHRESEDEAVNKAASDNAATQIYEKILSLISKG